MHTLFYYDANLTYLKETGPLISSLWYFKSFGAMGVHLFFVVSGFVMSMVAESRPTMGILPFVRDRVFRIVPIYWIVTALWIWLQPDGFANASTLAKSLFFFPSTTPPLLGVGWTLNYEMFFYAIFAVTVFMFRKRPAWLFLPLSMATLLPWIVGNTDVTDFFGSSLIWEFYAGILIFGVHRKSWIAPFGRTAFFLGSGLLVATIIFMQPSSFVAKHIILGWGFPSALVVLGCVVNELRCGPSRFASSAAARSFGEASYALYLTHPLMGVALYGIIVYDFRLQSYIGPDATVGFLVFVCCAVGIATHVIIEQPIARLLRRVVSIKRLKQSELAVQPVADAIEGRRL